MKRSSLSELPEDCIANVLCHTSPKDVCRLSTISSLFLSASFSDLVWKNLLPEDYLDILHRSSFPLPYSSLRDLYFRLCRSILIDNGNMCFWLEQSTGKKCYMFSAAELLITWSDTPEYWKWIESNNSRFLQVAELIGVCWLEIRDNFNTHMFSRDTIYCAYLVLQIEESSYGIEDHPVDISIRIGSHLSSRSGYLRNNSDAQRGQFLQRYGLGSLWRRLQVSNEDGREGLLCDRDDGWMELELGEFVCEHEDNDVEVSLMEVKSGQWKRGIIVEGIEIRPK